MSVDRIRPPVAQAVNKGTIPTMPSMLYVDDNEDNILLMRQLLRLRAHVELRVATTGTLGLELAMASQPTFILLDQHMPDLLGSDVISQLKKSATTASIPVVLFSADPGLAREADGWGADGFLPKPFELKHLLAVIDQYCAESSPRDLDAPRAR